MAVAEGQVDTRPTRPDRDRPDNKIKVCVQDDFKAVLVSELRSLAWCFTLVLGLILAKL